MGGGILQLVAYGTQDEFIMGNPEITFFKTVYRRHTNFSISEYDLNFSSNLDFGKRGRCRIRKQGDLLHKLFLVINLPEVETKFRFLTVGEVQRLLDNFNITWETDKDNDETFDEDDYNEIILLIDKVIDDINNELDIILDLYHENNNKLASEKFFKMYPDATEASVEDYYYFIISCLIDSSIYNIEYQFITSQHQDRTDPSSNLPLPLQNAPLLQQRLFDDFISFATGQTTFPVSDNDENIFFIFNTDTSNYNISGSVNQLDSNTVFRAGINNSYGETDFAFLDGYKIFDQVLDVRSEEINSNFDVQIIKSILLDNIRFGLKKNPKQLTKVYNSLNNDIKFIFYKILSRQAENIYTATDDFINLSLFSSNEPEFQDNFTSDFTLPPEPNEPSNIMHPYGLFIKKSVNNMHNNNRNTYRTNTYINYFNEFNLWTRTNVSNPGNSDIDEFDNLCQDELNELFGENLPDTIQNMYFLNYIPLLTANDIPIAIDRILRQKILENEENSDNISNFIDDLVNELEAGKNLLITNLTPKICITDAFAQDINVRYNNFRTLDRLSNFRARDGANGDIMLNSIVRKNDVIDYNGQKMVYSQYVINVYLDIVNNFTADGFSEELNDIIRTINTFATPTSQMINYTAYLNNNNNLNEDLRINSINLPILSDSISSIWYNLSIGVVNNYNNLYNDQILSRNKFYNDIGSEMQSYLDEISRDFFNTTIPINPQDNFSSPIDYWFNTPISELPVNNNGGIGTYLNDKVNTFISQLNKYDRNRKLLNMKDLIISQSVYYYEKFITILREIVDNNIEVNMELIMGMMNLVYDHEKHNTTDDPVLDIKDSYINPNNPNYDPKEPKDNAMDIFEKVESLFNLLISSEINPFDQNIDKNRFELWNIIWSPTKQFDEQNEREKYNFLFGNINAEELFKQTSLIDVKYNGFLSENDIYRYMQDIIISNSIFSPLVNFIGDTVSETEINILSYFDQRKFELEQELVKFEGDNDTPGLKEELLNVLNAGELANFAWIKKLGYYIINNITIKIGDQIIDKQYGEWLNIWQELSLSESKIRGNNILIGNVPELVTFNTDTKPKYELIIPLKFWFCRHIGSSLPLVALQHTFIDIDIELKSFRECAYFDNFVEFNQTPKLKCNLLAQYVYLEREERLKLAKSKLEYLIDVVQYSNDYYIDYNSLDENGIFEIKIYFENPVKELFWIMQDVSLTDGTLPNGEKQFHNYSTILENGKSINPIDSVEIKFSSRQRELFKDSIYYNYIQPYERHTNSPSLGINVYSFSLRPELIQPSGAANFSKIDDAAIVIKMKKEVINQMKEFGLKYRFGVYCNSYNWLRIMSGLGGLAFFI